MDAALTRARRQFNERLQLAHMTAQFTRAKQLPELKDLYIDINERPSRHQELHDPDDGLLQWAITLASKEQRAELCHLSSEH